MSHLVQQSTSEGRLADLEKRVAAIESARPGSLAFTDGSIVRVRLGKQLDGKYGLRVWNAAGVVVIDDTA